jgi:hypothetical protein
VSDPPPAELPKAGAGAEAPDAHDVDQRGRLRHWTHFSGDQAAPGRNALNTGSARIARRRPDTSRRFRRCWHASGALGVGGGIFGLVLMSLAIFYALLG